MHKMAKANSKTKPNCTETYSVNKGDSSKPLKTYKNNHIIAKKQKKTDVVPKANMEWLFENGDKMREIFSRECSLIDKQKDKTKSFNTGKVSKAITGGTKSSNTDKISKAIMGGRSVLISRKNKKSVKLFDNILKSELMIKDADCEPSLNNLSSKTYTPLNNYQYQDSSTEITNGISSPESLDSNSNRVKRSKTKPVKAPNKKRQKPKKVKTKVFKEKAPKAKEVKTGDGPILTVSLYQCDYCQKTFSTKTSLRRHIYTHLGIKPYSCDFCEKQFSQLCNLKKHADRKHMDYIPNTYICNICHKQFLLKENLALHIQSHVNNENEFKCLMCEIKFANQILLSEHEKRHHLVSGRYQCSICDMRYDSRTQLSLHVKKHLDIKDYVCHYCGKEFLRPNSVRRHIEICHVGFRIQCPICSKHLRGHLTEHLRTHDNKRPHKCSECGQRFTQATQLTVHRRSHTGDRPYPCRICDRPFTHSNALMLHIRRHTGEKPFTCAMCPNSFSQLPHMKAHMKKIHGKEAPYKCPKCNEFFKLKALLEDHVKTCTVGDRELSYDEKIQASLDSVPVVESAMSLSRMRFLLALLLTMIATKEKLKYLGFNKRLIDDLLIESLEAMGQNPCKDQSQSPIRRLKSNIQILLNGTIPPDQMEKFKSENKSTEELLELLTGEKKK